MYEALKNYEGDKKTSFAVRTERSILKNRRFTFRKRDPSIVTVFKFQIEINLPEKNLVIFIRKLMKGTENDRRLTIQAFEAIGQETYFLVKENTASVRTLTSLICDAL